VTAACCMCRRTRGLELLWWLPGGVGVYLCSRPRCSESFERREESK
jgi:hypothetical protein